VPQCRSGLSQWEARDLTIDIISATFDAQNVVKVQQKTRIVVFLKIPVANLHKIVVEWPRAMTTATVTTIKLQLC